MMWGEDLQHARVNISTATDNEIIEAPGEGKYIAIDFIQLLPSGGANTVTFKRASTTLFDYALDDNQPITIENSIRHEKGIIKMGANEAFNLNLSAATAVTGFVRYRILNN